jgi:CelD/BcsL family acetyltransferase involved in cellulose biosynthesis
MRLNVEAIHECDRFEAIESEWEALDREIKPRNPFTSPLWFRLWWKHFHREGLLIKDEFFLHTIRNDRAQLVAVAPLIRVHRPAFGPIRVRIIRFFAADTGLTEFRGVICRPSDETIVFGALRDFLYANKSGWDVIEWSGIRPAAEAAAILEAAGPLGPLSPKSSTPMYIVQLPQSWSELLSSLSLNMRKNLRKAYERSAGPDFEFRVIEHCADVESALNRFFRLHSLRAQAPNMVVHPDISHKNRAFLTEYFTEAAKRKIPRIFELSVNGNVVASRLAFYLDGTLYFCLGGSDPSRRHSSVGTILMAEALKWAMRRGIKTANLSAGKDLSKLRWKPTEIIFENYWQVSPSLHGRLFGQKYVELYAAFVVYRHRVREIVNNRIKPSFVAASTPRL